MGPWNKGFCYHNWVYGRKHLIRNSWRQANRWHTIREGNHRTLQSPYQHYNPPSPSPKIPGNKNLNPPDLARIIFDYKYTFDIWNSCILEAIWYSNFLVLASGRKFSSVFRVESIISKIEHDMTSHKEDLSEIKTMIQMLINIQGNREMVARPPVLP